MLEELVQVGHLHRASLSNLHGHRLRRRCAVQRAAVRNVRRFHAAEEAFGIYAASVAATVADFVAKVTPAAVLGLAVILALTYLLRKQGK